MLPKLPRLIPLILAGLVFATSPAFSEKKSSRKPPRTMGHSVVSPDYQRQRLPNGQWEQETYAIGFGNMLDPTGRDESLTTLSRQEMVEVIANALYRENYVSGTDKDNTDLLIVLNWGKTVPYDDGLSQISIDGMTSAMNAINQANSDIANAPSGPESGEVETTNPDDFAGELQTMLAMQSMADRARRQANNYNARLLGFAPEISDLYATDPTFGPRRAWLEDLEFEIETERYFVILQAYDFKKLVENKEKDLLWITRFSIRAKGRSFDTELANMANAASTLFGNKSDRLHRRLLPGRTSHGEIEVVETIEDEE